MAAPQPLSALLAGFAAVPGDDPVIAGLCLDSRAARPGDLFFALAGTQQDGLNYCADAVARGAVAVVYEAGVECPNALRVPAAAVPDLRARVGRIADRFFGAPSAQLVVIGVTGTNGKTTCTQLLAQVLDKLPAGRCAVIGTLGNGFPDALAPATHTTPDAVRVHALLAEFRAAGAAGVCMEVSSHALAQGRTAGVAFDVAVFTNLTRDHLDYHGDMAAYGEAKARLFATPGLRAAVVNVDDAFGRVLAERLRGRVRTVTFGLAQGDFRCRALTPKETGLSLEVETPAGRLRVESPLLGRFNAENLLAVLATLHALDIDLASMVSHLAAAHAPPGRMERFGGEGAPLVVVDYAHTPDALEKVLSALREHARESLWCVFGCGGNRDRGKRPLMGRVAERLADKVVVTSDNPRHEPPETIIAEIVAGMQRRPRVIADRREAIRAALREARPGDVVLVAGKGHEDYQQVGDARLPFSDRDVVRELLKEAA